MIMREVLRGGGFIRSRFVFEWFYVKDKNKIIIICKLV